jgi:hypothetical protein
MREQIKILITQVEPLFLKEKADTSSITAALIYDMILGVMRENLITLDPLEHEPLLTSALSLCKKLKEVDTELSSVLLRQILALAEKAGLNSIIIKTRNLLAKTANSKPVALQIHSFPFNIVSQQHLTIRHDQHIEALRQFNRAIKLHWKRKMIRTSKSK